MPRGGEWHENAHPNFLWMPERVQSPNRATIASLWTYGLRPSRVEELTHIARTASETAYPLCQVLKKLVDRSAGNASYRCPDRH